MSTILARAASAILKTRAPGQTKDEWAMEAARNVLMAIRYQDGLDEDLAIAASRGSRHDPVTVIECWDATIEEALK